MVSVQAKALRHRGRRSAAAHGPTTSANFCTTSIDSADSAANSVAHDRHSARTRKQLATMIQLKVRTSRAGKVRDSHSCNTI
jgi:hypothetical protein